MMSLHSDKILNQTFLLRYDFMTFGLPATLFRITENSVFSRNKTNKFQKFTPNGSDLCRSLKAEP